MNDWVKYYVNRCMKSEALALKGFALRPRKLGQGKSRLFIFELIQGYGGMHHWVKLCVKRLRKSEVIAPIRFCIPT